MSIYSILPKGRYKTTLRFLISVFFLTMPVFAFSQKVKYRTVCVIDSENNFVSGVNIKIDFCGKIIDGYTNEKGIFGFEVFEGITCTKANVRIQSYLYTPVDTLIDFSNSINSQIVLNSIALDEVKVIGYRKISQENAEKVTFSINTNGLLKSAKADMALRRIPNIIYSNGTFSLIGKQKKAKILVNGLEVSDQELSKLDAKNIDKVELYQVGLNDDQYAGEIRIILKKDLSILYKGEIDMGANLLSLGGNFSPSFTYRSKTIDFLAWGSYTNEQQESKYKINRNNKDVFSSVNHNHLQQYSAASKINIFFSPKWMSSLSYSFFGYNSPADVSWKLDGVAQPDKNIKESYYSNFVNIVVRCDLNHNERFFGKARYFNYVSKNSSSTPLTKFIGKMDEITGDFLYELDSLSLFKRYHNLAVGYKSIYRNSILTSSNKMYTSDVQQFYVKGNFSINDTWDFFVLLRGEWDGYKFEKNKVIREFSFLPSATLNYQSKIGSLSATYVKSIERPSIDYLNPDIFYINDFTQVKGNPNIKSQSTDKYSINYSKQIKDNYFTAVVSFSSIQNLINQIYSNDYNTSVYENVGSGQMFKLDIAYNKPFFSNALNVNLSVGAGYVAYKIVPELLDKVLSQEHRGWSFNSSMNLSYAMPKDWFINLSMNYSNKYIAFNAIYYKKPTFNLLLTKSLLQNNLDITLQYIDMFRLSGDQRVEYFLKGVNQISTFHLPTSRLSLSFVYRFGKQFKSRNIGRAIINEDITTK